jgi:predicted ester cyclase
MAQLLLLAEAAATLCMAGVLWTMQVLNYPLLRLVGRDALAAYETAHNRRSCRRPSTGGSLAAGTKARTAGWSAPTGSVSASGRRPVCSRCGCARARSGRKRRNRVPTNAETSPLAVWREWQRCLAENDQAGTARVVDLDGYTEICLGLTEWTTGYGVAQANFYKNMVAPWADMRFEEQDVTESPDGVTVRMRVEATQAGEFLGVPPTGRRLAWDHVAIVRVRDGRVVGQWAQPDLWGIHRQLTAAAPATGP